MKNRFIGAGAFTVGVVCTDQHCVDCVIVRSGVVVEKGFAVGDIASLTLTDAAVNDGSALIGAEQIRIAASAGAGVGA